MKRLETYTRELHPSVMAIGLFLFLMLITVYPIYRNALKLERLYLKQTTYTLETLVRATNRDLSHIALLIFDLRINRPEIVKIMAEASETDDTRARGKLRRRLYAKLVDVYRYLETFHIRQLHFHLPGPVSFLRFHKPEKYGDVLQGVRTSLDRIQNSPHAIHCFEEGRVFNGFRHVFPLWFRGKFVGSVEISFDAGAAIRSIVKTLPAYAEFMILESLVETKVWRSERGHYRPSLFSGRYLVDCNLHYKKSSLAQKIYEELGRIAHNIRTRVEPRLLRGEAFSINAKLDGNTYLITFLPIENCQGRIVAYLVTYQSNDFFEKNRLAFQRTVALAFVLNLLAALVFYRFLREERRLMRELEAYATTDPLTGVMNRRAFLEAARRMIRSNRRHGLSTSLIFFDLDHFKTINDRYGHDEGDEVLKSIAHLVKIRLRENDLLARWGGEEFVVLLDGTCIEDACKVAEMLRQVVEECEVGAQRRHVTVSLGVIEVGSDESVETAIERADQAMYCAKKAGRNRVVCRARF